MDTLALVVGGLVWGVLIWTFLAVSVRELFWAVQRWRKLL